MSDSPSAEVLGGLDGDPSIEDIYEDPHQNPELSHAGHRTAPEWPEH
jgi:hypothetical protein